MKIEYYKKNVYGLELMYIKESKLAAAVLQLTGRKTITASDVEALKQFGIEFVQVLP